MSPKNHVMTFKVDSSLVVSDEKFDQYAEMWLDILEAIYAPGYVTCETSVEEDKDNGKEIG